MDGEELIGIITERHHSRNVILKGKRSPTTLGANVGCWAHHVRSCIAAIPPELGSKLTCVDCREMCGCISSRLA